MPGLSARLSAPARFEEKTPMAKRASIRPAASNRAIPADLPTIVFMLCLFSFGPAQSEPDKCLVEK